jgi:hypothetical protein
MRQRLAIVIAAALATFACAAEAFAGSAVLQLGSGEHTRALLLTPDRGKPRGGIVLLPGADGILNLSESGEVRALQGNQLVRTREDYVRAGFVVILPDAQASVAAAVSELRRLTSPVAIVAKSRGSLRAARVVREGVRADALVLASAMLEPHERRPSVPQILGSPNALPRTLVIHHRNDGCVVTPPSAVEPFVGWSAGRARATWIDGGVDAGQACGGRGHHGFAGRDADVVRVIARFVAAER